MRAWKGLAWGVVALSANGCALWTDLGDLSGEPVASDAGLADAPASIDAPATVDAPSETDVSPASPATFSCSPAPTGTVVCVDFESATAACDGLHAPFVYGSGSGQIDPTHSVSPTRSAEYSAQAVDGPAASYACTIDSFNPGPTVSMSFALRVNQADPAASIPIANLADAGTQYEIALEHGALHFLLRDGPGQVQGDYELETYAPGAWIALRLDLARASSVAATVWVAPLAGLEPAPTSDQGWTQVFYKVLGVAPAASMTGFLGLGLIDASAVATDVEIDNYLLRSF